VTITVATVNTGPGAARHVRGQYQPADDHGVLGPRPAL